MSGLPTSIPADPNFGNFAFRETVASLSTTMAGEGRTEASPRVRILAACLDQDMGALALASGRSASTIAAPVLRFHSIVEPLDVKSGLVGTRPFASSDSTLYTTLLDHDGAYIRELTRLQNLRSDVREPHAFRCVR